MKKVVSKVINICTSCGELSEVRVYPKDVRVFCPKCNITLFVIGSNKYKSLLGTKKENKKIPLETLKTMDYEKYLNTGHWQRVRRNYFKKYPKICFCCGLPAYVLHHKEYKNRGEENDEDLIPLCEDCHNSIHRMMKEDKTIKLINAHEIKKTLLGLEI